MLCCRGFELFSRWVPLIQYRTKILLIKRALRSDERQTLETTALKVFQSGNSTIINSFDKTKFSDFKGQFIGRLNCLLIN